MDVLVVDKSIPFASGDDSEPGCEEEALSD